MSKYLVWVNKIETECHVLTSLENAREFARTIAPKVHSVEITDWDANETFPIEDKEDE